MKTTSVTSPEVLLADDKSSRAWVTHMGLGIMGTGISRQALSGLALGLAYGSPERLKPETETVHEITIPPEALNPPEFLDLGPRQKGKHGGRRAGAFGKRR